MTAKELKQLIEDQQFIRQWLTRIKETDDQIINEVMDLMRTTEGYREFIVGYARGQA